MKATTKTVVSDALAKGGEHLGDLLWWSLLESAIKAPAFRAIWTAAGLDEKYLPEDPTPKRALTDAGKHALGGIKNYLYEPAGSTDTETIFAVLRADVTAPGQVDTVQEARVAVDASGQFLTDNPSHPLVQLIRAKYDGLFGCFQAREVRRTIIRLLRDCDAVTMRDSGGVYWVPRNHAAQVRALQACIEKVGGSEVDVLPVHASPLPEGNKAISKAARGSIEAELTGLKAELDGFGKRDDVRPATLAARIESFQALRARANLYHSILSVEVDDLGARIEELEAEAGLMLATAEEKAAEQAA